MIQAKQKTKKISRRDAIKLLGAAAGATVLANLPTKWNTPEMASGVLPAHAQTSSSLLSINSCSNILCPDAIGGEAVSVTISQALAGVSMTYNFALLNGNTLLSPASGTALTNASGIATTTVFIAQNSPSPTSAVMIWSFTNPAQGTGACGTTFNWDNSCNN